MNKSELEKKLVNGNFDSDGYCLYGSNIYEGYCLDIRDARWCVFYIERGEESVYQSFPSEDEACEYFFNLISKDPTAYQ